MFLITSRIPVIAAPRTRTDGLRQQIAIMGNIVDMLSELILQPDHCGVSRTARIVFLYEIAYPERALEISKQDPARIIDIFIAIIGLEKTFATPWAYYVKWHISSI